MKLIDSTDKMIIRVCIDSNPNGTVAGHIAAPFLARDEAFADAGEMLLIIEAYLDATGAPPAFQRGRTFGGHKRTVELREDVNEDVFDKTGSLCTCAIRVTTRQNSTWQGYADFEDAESASFFASALELLFLIDSELRS